MNFKEQCKRARPYEKECLKYMNKWKIRNILRISKVRIRTGTKEEDTQFVADYVSEENKEDKECRIACRVLFSQNGKNYPNITVRAYIDSSGGGYDQKNGLSTGSKTELQKIIDGEGDFMITCFVNDGKIVKYVLTCLNALRTSGLLDHEIISKNKVSHCKRNSQDGNKFIAIDLDALEECGCIAHSDITGYYLEKLWHPLDRTGNFEDVTKK